ncbi:MAG: hypothetical protein HZC37_09755 [Burkholderiales bacterium]|nr:hypothetical protein [Burkholderiales bacterium]
MVVLMLVAALDPAAGAAGLAGDAAVEVTDGEAVAAAEAAADGGAACWPNAPALAATASARPIVRR